MGNKASTITPWNLHRYVMGGLLLLIVGIGAWLSVEAGHHADANIRRGLLRQASSIASTLSLESVREMSFRAEDAERPAFQRITSQLRAYAQTAGIRSLYTMSLRDGQFFFGPEGLLPDDPYATPPGTLYQKPSSYDFEAFRTAKHVVYGPYSDEFGEFISALIPVVDPLSGKVLMAVGADMEASAWRKQVHKARWMPILALLSPIVLLLLGYWAQKAYKDSAHMRVEYLRNIQITTYFAVMLLFAVIAFVCVRDLQHKNQNELFDAEASAKSQHYTAALKQVDFVLHMLAGYFEASDNVTRGEFSTFCQLILADNPIQACFWLPALSSTSAPAFTAQMRTEGFPEFAIRRFADDNRPDPNPADPIYPAIYVEPASRLPTTLGYDFYSHPALRETLLGTLRSGSDSACMVSAPISNGTELSGVFVFVPVSHARQEGFIGISIDLDALIKHSTLSSEIQTLSATLFELLPGKEPQPLICSSCTTCDDMFTADLTAMAPIFAFGKTYMMLFTAEPQWFSANPITMAWLALGIGLALSLLLTYTAAVLINRPLLLAKQVLARTRELAENKERYDIAISAAKMGVWEHDLQSDRLIWGDRMLEVYGIQKEEFAGTGAVWTKYIHPDDHNHFVRELAATKRGEKDMDTQVRIIRANGEIRYIRAYGKTIFGANQTPVRMIGVNLDVTEEVEHERMFQILFENMSSGAAIYEAVDDGRDFVLSDINVAGLKFGTTQREDVIGKRVAEAFPGVKDMGLFEVLHRVWRTGNPEDLPAARYTDGRLDMWLENHVLRLPTGQVVALFNDITERKQSQQALEESRQLLCNIIDSLPERVWWKDLDSRYMGCNIHVAHDAGFDHPDQLIGKTDFDMCWAVHAEAFIASDRELIESGIPRIYDPELQVLEDGSTRWIEVSMIPIRDTQGKIFGVLGTYSDITARKQAEENLGASEEQYRLLFDNMTTGFALHEMIYDDSGRPVDYRYLQVNPAFEKLTGLASGQVIGRTVKELMPETEAHWIENFGKVAKTGKAVTLENYAKEIGKFFEVRAFSPEQDRFAVVFADISERKQAQSIIEQNEDRLRRAQHVAHVGNWEFNMETEEVSASDEAKRIYGLEGHQWTISSIQEIPLVEDRGMLDRELEALTQYGKPYDIEFSIKRPTDGAVREIHSVAEYDPKKKLVFGVIQDITDRKRAERSLARSEAQYRDLFEQSADACLIIRDGRFVDCNQAAIEMLRCEDKKNVLEMHPAELSPERQSDGRLSLEKADEIMQRMVEEKSLRFEWLHKRVDGEIFPVEVSLTSITDSEGSHIIHTTWRDITDRKQAEENLIRLSSAIEQSPESIVITDMDGSILYINPAFETTTGYSADEVLGHNPRILNSGAQPPAFYAEMWETLLSGKVWEGRITNKRKNGTLFTEEASIAPVRDVNGRIVNYVAVKRNISEELVKDEELRQAQKMEAVGELAGGVAHDFNNILQGIIGFAELLRYSLDETSQEYENINEIHRAANRAAKLTQQLLTFSRKQAVRLEETDLNNVVYDSEALLHVLLGEKHELVLDLKDELPLAYADQSQLTQIIINLSVNARDAMPEGGRLTISTDSVLITEADAAYIAGAHSGRHLLLAVTDAGTGMNAETIRRIFEPFFTTKPLGAGTGLGLSVIYGIVSQNKGWINVYSEIGEGSCFKVYLPVAEPNEEPADGAPETGQRVRNARILLIEDDPEIATMVSKILGEADLTIIAAGSAEEGLERFDQQEVDLLMSDMELPGMRGDQLADALRKKNPDLPVLLFSGYRDHANRWRNFAEKGYLFLNKPFTISILLDTVQNMLQDAKGTHG